MTQGVANPAPGFAGAGLRWNPLALAGARLLLNDPPHSCTYDYRSLSIKGVCMACEIRYEPENETNKKAIDGYTRVFRSGQTKTYNRAEHP